MADKPKGITDKLIDYGENDIEIGNSLLRNIKLIKQAHHFIYIR